MKEKVENGATVKASNGAAAPPPSGEAENPTKRGRSGSTVALPLEVGTRVMCQWRDQKPHPGKVIERRKISNRSPIDYEYYVHYTECCEAYNLGFGKGTSILEMVTTFEKASGKKIPLVMAERRPGDAIIIQIYDTLQLEGQIID